MHKIDKYIIILVVILFSCWYFPVSFMNVFACDDFWFGANVHDFGFWGNQSHYWHNWEGSFTHTFLASLPHVIEFSRMPFICNMISLFLLAFAIFYFIRTYFKLSQRDTLFSSFLLSTLIMISTNGDSEIRFWVCANFTYLPELAFSLIFLARYHVIEQNRKIDWVWNLLLLFLIAGSKLTFISFTGIGMLLHDFLYKRKFTSASTISYILLFCFTLVNICAPGNLIRLQEEHLFDQQYSLLEIIRDRLKVIGQTFLYSIILLPFSVHLFSKSNNVKTAIYVAVAGIVGFIAESIILYICFGDAGPKRTYIIYETAIFIFMFYALGVFYNKLFTKRVYVKILSVIAGITFLVLNMLMLLQVSPSIEYAKKSRCRDQIITHAENNTSISLECLPDSWLLLSYFCNEEPWIENVYIPYFGKHIDVKINNNTYIE